MISAKIIGDSQSELGPRLITYVLTFPRIVLAEFNTHRMLTRNSASSRAIPFQKMLQMVLKNPFIPIRWMKDHSGMQGNEFFTDEEVKELQLIEDWLEDRDKAVEGANKRSQKGVTKQIVNRTLEPFMWHTVIASGTEWENFFALRADPQAEIHIQALAHQMLDAANASTPKLLNPGEWHIPFGDQFDEMRLHALSSYKADYGGVHSSEITDYLKEQEMIKVKIATARCARISYNTFEGKDDYEADIKLYDRLLKSGHLSPFEHCARVMSAKEFPKYQMGKLEWGTSNEEQFLYMPDEGKGWCGNYRGFIQLRKTLPNENRTDSRLIKK